MKICLVILFICLLLTGCGDKVDDSFKPQPETKEQWDWDYSSTGLNQGAVLVLSVEGQVSKIENLERERTVIKPNQIISPGAVIATGSNSKAVLLLTNGSTLSLGSDARLELRSFFQERFDASNLKLDSLDKETSAGMVLLDLRVGDLVVDVKKLEKKSNFEITTPLGVAGIRGTSFGLNVDSGSTGLSVLSGKVAFTSPNNGFEIGSREQMVLKEGFDPQINSLSDTRLEEISEIISEARQESSQVSLSDLEVGLGFGFYVVPSALRLKMIWVHPGVFTMGSPRTEKGRSDKELQHQVTLSKGFYLGKYEVTQAQWARVMGNQPSKFKGTNRPVERISWYAATKFCKRLTDMEREAGRLPSNFAYQLPTESEWEYACRAGTTTAYSWGNGINSSRANYNYGNDPNRPVKVGQFAANPWGFHDMHGNVMEWVSDWFAGYPKGSLIDPVGPATGQRRIKRGGCWGNQANVLRSAWRGSEPPGSGQKVDLGFRVALKAIQE